MSLEAVFLIVGAGLVAASSVSLRGSRAVGVRSLSSAALVVGALLLTIGLVNTLSSTA